MCVRVCACVRARLHMNPKAPLQTSIGKLVSRHQSENSSSDLSLFSSAASSSTVPPRPTRPTPRTSAQAEALLDRDEYSLLPTPGAMFMERPTDVDPSYTDDQRRANYRLAAETLAAKGSRGPLQNFDYLYYGKGYKGYYWRPPFNIVEVDTGFTFTNPKPTCGRSKRPEQHWPNRPDTKGQSFLCCRLGKDSPNDCGYFYWVRGLLNQPLAQRPPRAGEGPGEPTD